MPYPNLPFVVTIDGPSGSGKSTVAGKLAKSLGFVHLNSGLLFRAAALLALEQNVELEDEKAMARLAEAHRFHFEPGSVGLTQFWVDDRELTDAIRTEEIGSLASRVAVLPALRDVFLRVQRQLSQEHPLIVEGRDAGSVVFPDAKWKFYLDAPLEERARRRQDELKVRGDKTALAEIVSSIAARDERDAKREVAPHIQPPDSIRIDTSNKSIDQVVTEILKRVTSQQE